MAQSVPPVGVPPAGLDRINPVPQGSPLSGVLSNTPAAVAPSLKQPQAAPGAVSPNAQVRVTDVSVQGATAYTQASLQAMTTGLVGPAVQVQRIEAARTAILNRYRNDGYVYTTVNARVSSPSSQGSGGHLRFVVTEGRVVEVKLQGDIGPAGTQVLRFLRHLTDIQPINVRTLERWLLLAGDVPGVTVSSVLNPSKEDPGAFTLVAQLHRAPVTGQITADNRAFRQTGPEELLALVDLNSFTAFGERTELSIYHTFNNTETFGQGSEEFFIGGSGLRLRIYGGAGETIPSGSLREIGYDGITRVGGLEFTYPTIRTRSETLNLKATFDAIESEILLSANDRGQLRRSSFDSLRVLRAGADYTRLDTFLGTRFPATDLVSLRVSQGLHVLGATANGEKDAPRLDERTDFTKVSGEIDRTQSLFALSATSSVSLKLAAAGQYSRNILPPAEKFYLGGPHFDRGFYYGEVTADTGVETTVEPLLDVKLPQPGFSPVPLSAEVYAFYDWGESYSNQALDLNQRLRSLGGGVRFFGGDRVEIDVEGVSRLTRDPNGVLGGSRLKSSAIYWQVLGRF